MFNATGKKTRLWLLILVGIVTALTGQTHARQIFAPCQPAPGVFAAHTQATTGENYDVCRYDAPDSSLAANTGEEMVTVYRGVASDHPGLPAALEGKAFPRGGHSDPGFHNAGNTNSEFTSWTTSQSVADEFATSGGPGGVTLRQQVPRSKLIASPDAHGESEFLRLGPAEGADVLSPLPENIPDWFKFIK